ncbi:uncharacterized protein [Leptinotarsa decemlineata]|uniref:uncharacterized protein n=1 Tax=Leptinotarsa decemlineata TaxID=7539 RepID=UPI003D30BFDA
MFKLCIFVAIFTFAATTPVPEAKADPKADPSLIAAAYTAPVVAAPVAYTSAYSAPLAYASYVAPSVYPAGYTAYSPYTRSYVVLCIFVAILAFAATTPVPEAKADPKADPSLIAAAYTAPVVAAPVAYSAPLTYASYVSPSVYSAGYTAYSPYTGSYVVL